MPTKAIGFIGGGRVPRIFLAGWQRANAMPGRIAVNDCNAETLGKLQARFPHMDLIPVKPLAEMEPHVADMHRSRRPAIYQKIKP